MSDEKPACAAKSEPASGSVPCQRIGGYMVHPNAREVGEQEDGYPGGDIQRWECPDCGARWKQELPQ